MTELYSVCRRRGGPSRVTPCSFAPLLQPHCLPFTVEVGRSRLEASGCLIPAWSSVLLFDICGNSLLCGRVPCQVIWYGYFISMMATTVL
jgi:hypothetical protein